MIKPLWERLFRTTGNCLKLLDSNRVCVEIMSLIMDFRYFPACRYCTNHPKNFLPDLVVGLGYKAPTIFTEESERIQYKNVLPVSSETNKLESSYGANWDFNYKTSFADGAVGFSINQLFFYTYLNDPLFFSPPMRLIMNLSTCQDIPTARVRRLM